MKLFFFILKIACTYLKHKRICFVRTYPLSFLALNGACKWPSIHETSSSTLKVQSYKLINDKYMIASTQVTNTEIAAFIAVLVFKLLNCPVLL